ncbi:fungal hydrophobin [Suillus clintonianus]|uniref:fungal hydrophobin n=1 Tax=Suillus clintonianus TaxID=1904413 RepID=UPI001B880423|nr:fungal hydrophobin [Suillus clintonianus]KAG2123822.1 fungal hydrophobin [Suillus clintonianus]
MIAAIFALLPFALFVAADGQCNTGAISCCNSVTTYDSPEAQKAFNQTGLVDVAAVVNAFVGLSCSGVTVIGTSSGCEANQEPLCCEDNKYNGLVNLGCTPINVNL